MFSGQRYQHASQQWYNRGRSGYSGSLDKIAHVKLDQRRLLANELHHRIRREVSLRI